MRKTVLDVGNCSIDHSAIQRMVTGHFEAEVLRALGPEDALQVLENRPVDLVLVNRKMQGGAADGIDFIRRLKADSRTGKIPVMLLSDYPRYQTSAVDAGAAPGFGKSDLHSPEVREKLQPYLAGKM